jgi:hypothetical protein
MNCASCGAQNPAGARYCVHCGVEQSVPTPIAAVAAAAMAARSRSAVPQAANAAQAEPASDERARASASRAREPWPGVPFGNGTRPRDPAGGDPRPERPTAPAYASAPRRSGLAALLVAGCFVIAIAAFVGWRMLHGDATPPAVTAQGGSGESVMSGFPPDATPQNSRRPAATAPSSQSAPAANAPPLAVERDGGRAGAPGASTDAHAGKAEPGDATPRSAAAPPVEIKPLPARPAPKPARRPPAEKARVEPPAHAQAPGAPEAAAPAVAAAPRAAAPVVDRWTRMSDELSRCTREDFIMRVICDQRVRLRYCNGYWGKAAQCPANPTPDRGQ